MSETVNLKVDDNALWVELSENSSFLSGKHRIFLANVMGLKVSVNPFGYFIERALTNTTDMIVELVEYLKEEGASVTLNKEVKGIVETFDKSNQNFEEARILGRKFKKTPQKKILVPGFKRQLKSYQIPSVAHIVNVGNA